MNKNIKTVKTEPMIIEISDDEPIPELPKQKGIKVEAGKIKSESNITTAESYIDYSEYNPKPKKLTKKPKKQRKVHIDSSSNRENLVITQNIKKQKLKCIINVTNVCKHQNESLKSSYVSETIKNKKKKCRKRRSSKDRVTPQCLRLRCVSSITAKSCSCREDQGRNENKKTKQRRLRSSKKSNKGEKRDERILLSPISSCSSLGVPLEDSSVTYEDISSDSLRFDSELDSLIKRAKNRDAEQVNLLENSSPMIDVTSEDDKITKHGENGSIHSAATLVLERQGLYSPTDPTGTPNRSQDSPTSKTEICLKQEPFILDPEKENRDNNYNIFTETCVKMEPPSSENAVDTFLNQNIDSENAYSTPLGSLVHMSPIIVKIEGFCQVLH